MLLKGALLAAAAASANAAGLVDNPIQGAHVQYLDSKTGGLTWTAQTNFSGPHTCSFLPNTDYDEGPVGETAPATSPQDCCDKCAAADDCAAGVLANNICYFKRPEELKQNVTKQGVTACNVNASPGQPLTIAASVPGDLITDLQTAGQIGDPLYELNWLNSSLWQRDWTYSTQFTLDAETRAAGLNDASSVLLVFDGIKMGASVRVNGQEVGTATDQFRRYTFELNSSTLLLDASDAVNTLEVVFQPSVKVDGRFMACTGGWDWAPYSNDFNADTRTLSLGIWKSVYLVAAAPVAIEHVVPQIFYRGAYPTSILQEGAHGGFDVEVRVHFIAATAVQGTLSLSTAWGAAGKVVSQHISLPAGNTSATVNTTAEAADIKLWWPANTGRDHPLYNLTVSFLPDAAGASAVSATRVVGFRHVALVTGNDTDPAYVQQASTEEGTELGFGMFFRINGAALFTRGANMIPMEEYEGRMLAEAHTLLVQNAVAANFNILRVWGGGMFLPDAFYDECDKQGIVVYHDMQYAQEGHAPAVTSDQDAELRHQIRRLSSHPSIIIWDGCNECQVVMKTSTAIYATFVLTVVAQEDRSRAVWPSCPAVGWAAGVDRLTARPNGNALTTPNSAPTIETHGPYQHGGGWPCVNGDHAAIPFDANIPINVASDSRSVSQKNVYASEFGSSVFSSFESMSATLAPEHWGIHGGAPADNCSSTQWPSTCTGDNTMAQRNYPCDNIIFAYFGQMDLSGVGEQEFKKQLYLCMLGQALLMKSDIETRRSKNELGIIVWQYNEIWPTGGWGSIEYGTPVKGQVIGGRWKPLHHFYEQSIYTDVMATCGSGGQCYVSNDGIDPFKGSLTINQVDFAAGTATPIMATMALDMPAGMAVTQKFQIDTSKFDATNGVLIAEVTSSATNASVSRNVIAMAPPAKWQIPKATVTITSVAASAQGGATVQLSTDKTALYVTLTTLATGRFSENAFVLLPGAPKSLAFLPYTDQPVDLDLLKSSIRVEHLASYLVQ